ncbi:transposase [Rhizobium laguerreae]|nr:transposase [Rhizobium laguerreae]MBY3348370.1 transposase [Rhizobium laguerreae]MBY3355388.1 transposase [Rhizobium laguerreae]MBY3369297.1 transposase [Rhizobium laguerreae]MBY3376524.1 transposase [Rhizobium laguerreae]MBY3390616.1 transposase [Rhizobium laguerreae]
MRRIEPYFPLSHGIPRVNDRLILSGIIFVLRNGLRWRDARREYGPHKTIYNRFICWSTLGVFNRIRTDRQTGQARAVDDRRYPLESPPHRSRVASFPRSPTKRLGSVLASLISFTPRVVARMVREMRPETSTRPSRRNCVAMGDLEIAALMAEAAANNDEVEGVLLNLAGMIQALKIMVDEKFDVRKGD